MRHCTPRPQIRIIMVKLKKNLAILPLNHKEMFQKRLLPRYSMEPRRLPHLLLVIPARRQFPLRVHPIIIIAPIPAYSTHLPQPPQTLLQIPGSNKPRLRNQFQLFQMLSTWRQTQSPPAIQSNPPRLSSARPSLAILIHQLRRAKKHRSGRINQSWRSGRTFQQQTLGLEFPNESPLVPSSITPFRKSRPSVRRAGRMMM